MKRTALVTGASSGIGAATARLLVARGYRVLGTSRTPDSLPDSARVAGVEYLPLDLTDHDSVQALPRLAGAVDVLVNNAGESQSGPLEELPAEAVERLFRVNVLAPVELTRLLLPAMRESGYGRVVMIGSMLASFPLAHRSSYVATKAALKGFATAARFEVAPYGVRITTVEPGSIKTGISERRTNYVSAESPYRESFHRMLSALNRNEGRGISPDVVARTVLRAIEADRPASLYAVGSNAPFVFALRRLLPRGVVEKLVARSYGVS